MELTSAAYLTPPPGEFEWNVTLGRVGDAPDPDGPSYSLDHCNGFMIFFYTFVFGFLCLFGLAGNTLSILVLNRDRQNRVAVFLLQSLAVADNSVLCLSFVALSIFYGLHNVLDRQLSANAKPIIIRYINPLGCAAQSSAIWITVLLAVNRYAAVCRPFASKKWLTVKLARVQVFVVVCFSVLLNIPRVFHAEITGTTSSAAESVNRSQNCSVGELGDATSNASLCVIPTPTTRYFDAIYLNGFYTSVVLVLPLVLLVGFNVPLIRQLQAAKRNMIRNSLSYSGQQENNITVVMVIIVLVMVVCHTPDRIVQVVLFFKSEPRQRLVKNCPYALFYAIAVSNCLVMLNSSVDFIVYYLFRKRFRKVLCQRLWICCCCCCWWCWWWGRRDVEDPGAAAGADGFSSKGQQPGALGGGATGEDRSLAARFNGTGNGSSLVHVRSNGSRQFDFKNVTGNGSSPLVRIRSNGSGQFEFKNFIRNGSPLVRVHSNGSRQFDFRNVINGTPVDGCDKATPV